MSILNTELFQEPKRIKTLLEGYGGIWAIAGGWALDLYLQTETRIHKDIEIAIPRNEQLKLKNFLKEWKFNYVKNGEFVPWDNEEFLTLPIHEIHAKNEENEFEILLNEIDEKVWTYRRNPKVKYPIEKLYAKNLIDINFLVPEIVLLYKVKLNKTKDIEDLKNTISILSKESKTWLINSIEQESHNSKEWITQIETIQQTT
ncbi:MAG: hypothetical protein QM535_21805 [Limnohabitans sp.]|nr:hypothetical protein [Limnohabitans sp.]